MKHVLLDADSYFKYPEDCILCLGRLSYGRAMKLYDIKKFGKQMCKYEIIRRS